MREAVYLVRRRVRRIVGLLGRRPNIVETRMYVHQLNDIPENRGVEPKHVRIRELKVEEIGLVREVWPVSIGKMSKRLERGDKCFSAFVDGKISHYLWVQFVGAHYIQPAGRRMMVKDGEAVVYHVRVADGARGRGLGTYAYISVLRTLRGLGLKRVWNYTTCDNLASQRSMEKAGWRPVYLYRSLIIGPFVLPFGKRGIGK